jgi:hypothetical protein
VLPARSIERDQLRSSPTTTGEEATRVAPRSREDRRGQRSKVNRPCAARAEPLIKKGREDCIYIYSLASPHSTSQGNSYLLSPHPRSTRNTQSWVPPLPNPQLPSRPTPLLPSSTTRSGRPSPRSRSTTRCKMIVRLRGRPRWG